MIYENLDALSLAVTQIDTEDSEQIKRLRRLMKVYFEALYYPPDGVIGVGAITYAEQQLVAAQLNETE